MPLLLYTSHLDILVTNHSHLSLVSFLSIPITYIVSLKLLLILQAKKHSNPPVSLHGQLLWREFFFTAAYGTPNFNKMEGNRVCLQVPWDNNPEFVKAWAEVCTAWV